MNEHRRLDINFKPCIPIQLTEENKHLRDSECIVDLKNATDVLEKKKEIDEYLNDPHLEIIVNSARFDAEKFDETTIVRESVSMSR